MITTNIETGIEKKMAIEKAVDEAIKENLLEGFFKIHRAEVIGMCLTEIDEEEAKRIWHKDGFTEGKNEGRSEKAEEAAINFLKLNKLSPEDIALALDLPLKKVHELKKKDFCSSLSGLKKLIFEHFKTEYTVEKTVYGLGN